MHHLLNRHVLRLGNEQVDEQGHDDLPRREKQEWSVLEMAQDAEESLRDDKRHGEVHRHDNGLSRRANLHWENFTGHQPS